MCAMNILIEIGALYILQGKISEDRRMGSLCFKISSAMRYFILKSLGKEINIVLFLINYLLKKIVVTQAFLFLS